MPTFFQTALQVLPSYISSFFPPNVGATKFSQDSAWQEYLSDAGRNGFGLPNRFLMFIESPWLNEKFGFTQTQFDKRLTYRCWSVNIPGQYFSKLERDIAGPVRRIPYTTTFDEEITMQFYCSPDMAEFGFIKKWMDSILNPVSRYAAFYEDFAKDTKATLLFIPNNLKTLADIQEMFTQNKLRGLRFTELYPQSLRVNGGTVEWASSSKPSFIQVGFAFREAVDITTYDAEVSKQLRDLADIAANPLSSNLTKFMESEGIGMETNIGLDGNVITNAGTQSGILGNSEVGQSAVTRGIAPLPGNGQLYADGGTVKTVDLGGLETLESAGGIGAGGAGNFPAGSPFANNGGVSVA